MGGGSSQVQKDAQPAALSEFKTGIENVVPSELVFQLLLRDLRAAEPVLPRNVPEWHFGRKEESWGPCKAFLQAQWCLVEIRTVFRKILETSKKKNKLVSIDNFMKAIGKKNGSRRLNQKSSEARTSRTAKSF
jgi:hypothetical protein